MIFGVAGPYCAGKSLAAKMLVETGCIEIDVDALGHAAREVKAAEIQTLFGTRDRTELGKIVFSDPGRLAQLEELLHPWMIARVEEQSAALTADGRCVVINAALLYPMGLNRLCDRIFWIDAPVLLRFWRAVRRDGTGLLRFLARVRSQRRLYPQNSPKDVDSITIANIGSREAFRRKLLSSM